MLGIMVTVLIIYTACVVCITWSILSGVKGELVDDEKNFLRWLWLLVPLYLAALCGLLYLFN